jgi:hypothetical protein
MKIQKQSCFQAAQVYLRRDWSVLALCPPHHQGVPDYHRCYCRQSGKRPLGRWKEWQTSLPTLDEIVEQWEMVPLANVGVVLGPVSGIIGIDIDGAEGDRILEEVVSCEPTAHRSVQKVFLPPPQHPLEWLWEPPAAAWLVVG